MKNINDEELTTVELALKLEKQSKKALSKIVMMICALFN